METVTNEAVSGFEIQLPDNTTKTVGHADLTDNGKMKSLMNSYGTTDNKGLYPEMLAKLDEMAEAFADEFNEVHERRYRLR